MVILVDANVVMDYITSREPFYRESFAVMNLCYDREVKGYIAFHSVSILWYSLRKVIREKSERRLWMKKILGILEVIGANHEAVGAQYIVTNNVKDFGNSTVSAITPAAFCKLFED